MSDLSGSANLLVRHLNQAARHRTHPPTRMDLPGVVAGLTLPYSDGPGQGADIKAKFLKRRMYGGGTVGREGPHMSRQ